MAAAAVAASVVGAGPALAGDTTVAAVADKGSMHHIAAAIGAHDSYLAGYTGKGIGVALIDTGVTNVPGLKSGNVVDGPDLSFDSQDPELAHQDVYGHGTHLASIIAGRDQAGTPESYLNHNQFTGIAPDATLVDVKVGAQDGAVDVTQVIAAIDWVVEHKADHNIRVINLSYGTDSTQDPKVDPLAYAAEQAWLNGIVVVVAGGNDGSDNYNLANPARDPFILAVGAADTQGTVVVADDTVPSWATRGTNQRHVDVVAPGVSVQGLRVPNGYADERYPEARVGDRKAKASGTSQAAAVVSGQVALMLQANPDLTPDEVKRRIMVSAKPMPTTSVQYRGSGLVQVRAAQLENSGGSAGQSGSWGRGNGSIESARGTSHVSRDGVALIGEVDIFGNRFDVGSWARAAKRVDTWSGGYWRGVLYTGDGWDGTTWRTVEWTQPAWDAKTWRMEDWAAKTWRDGSWTAKTWREDTWSAKTWRDASWSAKTWRTADLASAVWG